MAIKSIGAKRNSVSFPYDLPNRKSPEDVRMLVDYVRNGGDPKELIECHLRLVISIAAQYAADMPNKSDDLIGVACLETVKCVNKIVKGDFVGYDITSYIDKCVRGRLRDFLSEDSTIRVPRKSFKSNEDFVAFKNSVTFVTDYDCCDECCYNELEEILDLIVETPLEVVFVKQRKEGKTLQEIADYMGVSKVKIFRVGEKLREKYRRLIDE